jgi:hypothetical protein
MTEHDELQPTELTPTLAETARRRADLYLVLVATEKALAKPATGREGDWSKVVLRALEDLEHAIDEHIEITERAQGLYDEISQKSPRLASKIEQLKLEHPELREETRGLAVRFETTQIGDAWPVAEARTDVQRLLGKMIRHRQHGSDLVWEAYNLDIGGIE